MLTSMQSISVNTYSSSLWRQIWQSTPPWWIVCKHKADSHGISCSIDRQNVQSAQWWIRLYASMHVLSPELHTLLITRPVRPQPWVLHAPEYTGTKKQTITPDALQQSWEAIRAVAGKTSAQRYRAGLDTAGIENPKLLWTVAHHCKPANVAALL